MFLHCSDWYQSRAVARSCGYASGDYRNKDDSNGDLLGGNEWGRQWVQFIAYLLEISLVQEMRRRSCRCAHSCPRSYAQSKKVACRKGMLESFSRERIMLPFVVVWIWKFKAVWECTKMMKVAHECSYALVSWWVFFCLVYWKPSLQIWSHKWRASEENTRNVPVLMRVWSNSSLWATFLAVRNLPYAVRILLQQVLLTILTVILTCLQSHREWVKKKLCIVLEASVLHYFLPSLTLVWQEHSTEKLYWRHMSSHIYFKVLVTRRADEISSCLKFCHYLPHEERPPWTSRRSCYENSDRRGKARRWVRRQMRVGVRMLCVVPNSR